MSSSFANTTNYFVSRIVGTDLYILSSNVYSIVDTDKALSNLNISFDNVQNVIASYAKQTEVFSPTANTTSLVNSISEDTNIDSNTVWQILFDFYQDVRNGDSIAIAVLSHKESLATLQGGSISHVASETITGNPAIQGLDLTPVIIILALVLGIQLLGVF